MRALYHPFRCEYHRGSSRAFGVTIPSAMGKRGIHPVSIADLLFWEQQWWFTFKYLRDGAAAQAIAYWPQPSSPQWKPRVSGIQELDRDRLGLWITKENRRLEDFHKTAGIESRHWPGIPAERELWQRLLRAETVRQVRAICGESTRWLNPVWRGRIFVQSLRDHADEFLAAKKDSRYPRDVRRESSDLKRIDYFARAMAGIEMNISPVTAIDRLRKWKHSARCSCWRCFGRNLRRAEQWAKKRGLV